MSERCAAEAAGDEDIASAWARGRGRVGVRVSLTLALTITLTSNPIPSKGAVGAARVQDEVRVAAVLGEEVDVHRREVLGDMAEIWRRYGEI